MARRGTGSARRRPPRPRVALSHCNLRLLFFVSRRTVALSLALLHDAISDRHTLRRVTARVLLRAVRGRTELRPRDLCTWWGALHSFIILSLSQVNVTQSLRVCSHALESREKPRRKSVYVQRKRTLYLIELLRVVSLVCVLCWGSASGCIASRLAAARHTPRPSAVSNISATASMFLTPPPS